MIERKKFFKGEKMMKTGKVVTLLILAIFIVFSTVYMAYGNDDEVNVQMYAAEQQDEEMSSEEMDREEDVVIEEQSDEEMQGEEQGQEETQEKEE
jgi:cell division protein FtsL